MNGVLLEDGDGEDLAAAEPLSDVVFPDAQVTLTGVEMVDENTYYSPQDGGTITFAISQPVTNCETYLVVEGMDFTCLLYTSRCV